uniref:NBS-LRR-like resistance protein n=1 Tax=Oryza sativa TaxID=4530 RepID=A0A0U2QHZ3_ORYSA|nr:NBS-LRR-like resistance protein [Oryza sativa]
MGVMNPLMAKLTTLMGDEYKKLRGLRKQVSFLKDELTTMSAFLEKLALMDDDDDGELDPLAKDWRNHVREMAYDMEDCIDDYFTSHLDHRYSSSDAGLIRKIARRLRAEPARSMSSRLVWSRQMSVAILSSIQSKLDIGGTSQVCDDVQQLIDDIRAYLEHERYIIIVDDLWKQEAWDIISCAFPNNGKGSRVIVTTRVKDVARLACGKDGQIYRIQPLNNKDSRKLFFDRVFRPEDSRVLQYEEISTEILKKCSGLPLAIVTVGSLLACRPRTMDEWRSIRDSLGAPFDKNKSLEGMRNILNLSYKNLPLHLKTCLLYIGKYPEDYEIGRDELVTEWIAEGTMGNPHGENLEATGNGYFSELINRGLTQPESTGYGGEVLSRKVHDMMLDLILIKCAEDNFVSVAHSCKDYMRTAMHHERSCNKVCRLSLQCKAARSDCAIEGSVISASMARARSVSVFGECSRGLPFLMLSKYIRVVHIELEGHGGQVDLTAISHVLQLRYLRVETPGCEIDLPSKICGLVHLETLSIFSHKAVSRLPSDISSLPRLSVLSLVVPWATRLPNKLNKLKGSLRSLTILFNPPDAVGMEAIGELKNLRDLNISVNRWRDDEILSLYALGSSIGKLDELRSLQIHVPPATLGDVDLLCALPIFAQSFERLILHGWCFSRVPRWINGTLRNLQHVLLEVSETSSSEVDLLGELPSLADLELRVGLKTRDVIAFGGTRASLFPALLKLKLRVGEHVASRLQFQAGVMPKLQSLHLWFRNCESGIHVTPEGMQHLLSLQSICVEIYLRDEELKATYPWDAMERAFREITGANPNRPSFKFVKQV